MKQAQTASTGITRKAKNLMRRDSVVEEILLNGAIPAILMCKVIPDAGICTVLNISFR